jgi:hypothetical protein
VIKELQRLSLAELEQLFLSAEIRFEVFQNEVFYRLGKCKERDEPELLRFAFRCLFLKYHVNEVRKSRLLDVLSDKQ